MSSFHIWLNCINLEWNWTNSWNRVAIFDRSLLLIALPLIVFKQFFISSVNWNSIEHVPNPKIAKHFTAVIILVTSKYCIKAATKNPVILFVSNGNLERTRLRERKKLWSKFQSCKLKCWRNWLPHGQRQFKGRICREVCDEINSHSWTYAQYWCDYYQGNM